MSTSNRDFKYLASREPGEECGRSEEDAVTMDYQARPAWRNQWFEIAAAVLLLALFLFIAGKSVTVGWRDNIQILLAAVGIPFLPLVSLILYRRHAWLYTITADTIESSHGIVARSVQSIRLQDLRNVNVRQTFMQRLLGVGDVEFSSAGGAGIEVVFYGVPDPIGIKDRVQQARRD